MFQTAASVPEKPTIPGPSVQCSLLRESFFPREYVVFFLLQLILNLLFREASGVSFPRIFFPHMLERVFKRRVPQGRFGAT